jgi:CheY-like chemotaxis protein
MPSSDAQTETQDAVANILVVDDEPINIDVASGVLKSDYKVRAATNGKRALDIAFSDNPPDLILLDIMMPEMDGLEVCRRLKADAQTRDIPVIFFSAMSENEDIVRGLELGAVDYVPKGSSSPEVLKARVKTHLQLREAQKRLQREMQLTRENANLREDVERITRHDLKNPLGIILGYASMMADDETLPDVHRESARFMEESAFTIMNMVNNSLNLYKIEQGNFQLDAQPLNVIRIIEKAVHATNALAKNLGVKITFTAHAKNVTVLGDEMLCYSLLSNLLRNAVEATPKGSTVEVFIRDKGNALICVHNEGAIPEDIREHFFDKYVTAGKKQGTGLGTYSARLMTEVQNGQIEFETSKDHGTTLKVSLPLG